jgi:hypothetical protein
MQRLIYAHAALERAKRQLDELQSLPVEGPKFPDRLGAALDYIYHVTREIDKAGKFYARPKPAYPLFWNWWDHLWDHLPDCANPIVSYRNSELKWRTNQPGWVQCTRIEVTIPLGNDSSIIINDQSATSKKETLYVSEVVEIPHNAQVGRYFRGGTWDGQLVIETLAKYLKELQDSVIPEAEQRLPTEK